MARAKQCCLAVLSIAAGCALSQTTGNTFAQHLRDGTEEGRLGNFSAARADLEAAVALDSTSPEAWYQLGLLLGQMADFRGAESAFRRAVALQPEFPQAHYSLGLTLTANPRSKLDWPGAISEFRAALKYKPDYAEALNMLGAGLTSTGDIDAAIPELERAVKIKPVLSSAHFNLAIALEKGGKLEDAAREYRLAVSTKGSYPEATSALGKLLLRIGKPAEAQQELEKALRQNPDLTDAHYALARTLQSLNRQQEATIEFAQAKDLGQREPDAMQSSLLSNTALELASKGDFTGAAATLRKAIALKPDYGIPHYNLGLILADQGDMAGAAQELAKAISLMPGQPKPWFDLGRVRKRQGDRTGALQAISWAARLSPSDAAIRSELASLRDADSSVSPANEAPFSTTQPPVGARSNTSPEHIAFASELIAQRDYLGAVGELRLALTLQTDAIDARRLLADCYEHLGDRDRAVLEYRKIVRVKPDDDEAHIGLGKILFENGNVQEAAEEFRIALVHRPDSAPARAALDRANRALAQH